MYRLVGNKAPDFTLPVLEADGETFSQRSLKDYENKWLVLFFYPLDFTFICPTELTEFSKYQQDFLNLEAEILSVSTDSVHCHLAWQRNGLGQLGYPMAADQTLDVSQRYGVLLEEEGISLRGLFLIDPEQTIRYALIHDNNVGRNVQEVLRVLAALKTGGLCGAGWTLGEENLQPTQTTSPVSGQWNKEKVTVYSMPACSYCQSVKDFLTEQQIPFQQVDLATDKEGQAFMKKRKYSALPVTVVGKNEISGYDMAKIKNALGLS